MDGMNLVKPWLFRSIFRMKPIMHDPRFWLTSLALGMLCMGALASSSDFASDIPDPEPGLLDFSGTFSGRVWNDLNRNGTQDEGEPGMTNLPINVGRKGEILICGGLVSPQIIAHTDSNGYYSFNYSSNDSFYVVFGHAALIFGISPLNVGTNDGIDSDLAWPSYSVTNINLVATNIDIGLYYWTTGISLEIRANQIPIETPLHVTNGTMVNFTYSVTNTGEANLSFIFIYDDIFDVEIGLLYCPFLLHSGESFTVSTQIVIYASVTNSITAAAYPVTLCCEFLFNDFGRPTAEKDFVVIVDEWADELKIQSLDPAGNIFFSEISNAVSYQVDWTTNLTDTSWSTSPPVGASSILSIGQGTRVITTQLDHAAGMFRVTAEKSE